MTEKTDHDMIQEMHTAIFGTNGQGGCYRSCEKTRHDFYNFRLIVFVVIVGGGGSFGIAELIKKLLTG